MIPIEFKKYFWDTDFSKLDMKKNKRYIIARIYCYGEIKDIRWIKNNFSNEDIEDVARNYRDLKPLVANYLRMQCNLKKEDMAYYIWNEKNNYEYWRVKRLLT